MPDRLSDERRSGESNGAPRFADSPHELALHITAHECDSKDPFEHWRNYVLKANEMNEKSLSKYKSLWNTYRAWMIARQGDWDTATQTDIEAFLDGGSPGATKSSRKPINPDKMSSYTRQRYWRVLRGVYASAVRAQLIDNNPALDLSDAERPSIARSDRQSQILEPFLFQKLCDPATLRSILELSSEDDWWHVRDRAIIAILASTGITSAELLDLKGSDVCRSDRSHMSPNLALPLEPQKDAGFVVDVMQTTTTLGRTLNVDPKLAPFVRDWLTRRETLLRHRAARSMTLVQRDAYLKENNEKGAFFISRRAKDSSAPLPRMEKVTLYYLVSQVMKALRKKMSLDGTDSPYVAKGPAVIRNSVIRIWLDRYGKEETVRLAGPKNEDSLRLFVTAA